LVVLELLRADEQIFKEFDGGHEGKGFGLIESLEDRGVVRQGDVRRLYNEL
jgi:hypothetical protein